MVSCPFCDQPRDIHNCMQQRQQAYEYIQLVLLFCWNWNYWLQSKKNLKAFLAYNISIILESVEISYSQSKVRNIYCCSVNSNWIWNITFYILGFMSNYRPFTVAYHRACGSQGPVKAQRRQDRTNATGTGAGRWPCLLVCPPPAIQTTQFRQTQIIFSLPFSRNLVCGSHRRSTRCRSRTLWRRSRYEEEITLVLFRRT